MPAGQAQGNPLELPRGLSPAQLAAGFGLPDALPGAAPLAGRIYDSFARQLHALPDRTRRLLLPAAADPSGDGALVWQAAGRLGIPVQAPAPAVEAGLAEFGARRRLRHPLVRSASYWSASAADRQAVHGVLVTSLIRRLTRIAGPGTGPGRGRTRRGPHLATR